VSEWVLPEDETMVHDLLCAVSIARFDSQQLRVNTVAKNGKSPQSC